MTIHDWHVFLDTIGYPTIRVAAVLVVMFILFNQMDPPDDWPGDQE